MNKKSRDTIYFTIIAMFLIAASMTSLYVGSVKLSLTEITNAIIGISDNSMINNIVNEIRLPRILSAIILGGALAVSGYLLQTFFLNPIAGPFILGISSGAKLMIVFTMILSLKTGLIITSTRLILSAFLGSMLSMIIIISVSQRVEKSSTLMVIGVMLGYMFSAITDFSVNFADDSNIVNLHNWSMGSFSGINGSNIVLIAVLVIPTVLLSFLLSKQLIAYQLGEEYTATLGMNIRRFRIILILISSLLSACVTAFAGPVSFVGITVPHISKKLFVTAKPQIIIPSSFFLGAVFCLIGDMIARTVLAPSELSISTVMSLFGTPTMIWIMLNQRKVK